MNGLGVCVCVCARAAHVVVVLAPAGPEGARVFAVELAANTTLHQLDLWGASRGGVCAWVWGGE